MHALRYVKAAPAVPAPHTHTLACHLACRGLEQTVALPPDSFCKTTLRMWPTCFVGPPLMFVVRDLKLGEGLAGVDRGLDPPNGTFSAPHGDIDRVCSTAGCEAHSLLNEVARAAAAPWQSHLAGPAASWLDDFMAWGVARGASVLPRARRGAAQRQRLPAARPGALRGRPGRLRRLRALRPPRRHPRRPAHPRPVPGLAAPLPGRCALRAAACAKGGAGAEQMRSPETSMTLGRRGLGGRRGAARPSAPPTRRWLQADFIDALRAARAFAKMQSRRLGLDVYAYSIFHASSST